MGFDFWSPFCFTFWDWGIQLSGRWADVDFLLNDISCNFWMSFPSKHQQTLYLARKMLLLFFRSRWLSLNWSPSFLGFIFYRETIGFSQKCSFHCSIAWYNSLLWNFRWLYLSKEKTDNMVLPWAPLQLCWGCICLIHTSMESQRF